MHLAEGVAGGALQERGKQNPILPLLILKAPVHGMVWCGVLTELISRGRWCCW